MPSPGQHGHVVVPVSLRLHQVESRAERDQVRVVGGRGDRHGARAADVGVAQLVRERLQFIRLEVVVVPQHVVMGRPAGALGTNRHTRQQPGGGGVGMTSLAVCVCVCVCVWGEGGGGVTHLDPSVTAQVEVELRRVRDAHVYSGPSGDVTTLPALKQQQQQQQQQQPMTSHVREWWSCS